MARSALSHYAQPVQQWHEHSASILSDGEGDRRRDAERAALPVTGGPWTSQIRMQGCGRGAGGPRGERNGNYRDGLHTKESKAAAASVRKLMRQARDLLKEIALTD